MATKPKEEREETEPAKRECFQVMIQLGRRHYNRLEQIAKPFGMTPEEAAQLILVKQLDKE